MVIFPIHVYFINSSFLYSPFKSQGSALDPFQDGQLKGEGEGGVKGGGIHLEKCIIQDRTWMSIKTISIFFFFPRKLNVFENFSRISHDIISIIFWKFREPITRISRERHSLKNVFRNLGHVPLFFKCKFK